ncbi:MAG: hypothetical protein ACKO2Z_35990 [Sphaerospermopsis kisseleviana]
MAEKLDRPPSGMQASGSTYASVTCDTIILTGRVINLYKNLTA